MKRSILSLIGWVTVTLLTTPAWGTPEEFMAMCKRDFKNVMTRLHDEAPRAEKLIEKNDGGWVPSISNIAQTLERVAETCLTGAKADEIRSMPGFDALTKEYEEGKAILDGLQKKADKAEAAGKAAEEQETKQAIAGSEGEWEQEQSRYDGLCDANAKKTRENIEKAKSFRSNDAEAVEKAWRQWRMDAEDWIINGCTKWRSTELDRRSLPRDQFRQYDEFAKKYAAMAIRHQEKRDKMQKDVSGEIDGANRGIVLSFGRMALKAGAPEMAALIALASFYNDDTEKDDSDLNSLASEIGAALDKQLLGEFKKAGGLGVTNEDEGACVVSRKPINPNSLQPGVFKSHVEGDGPLHVMCRLPSPAKNFSRGKDCEVTLFVGRKWVEVGTIVHEVNLGSPKKLGGAKTVSATVQMPGKGDKGALHGYYSVFVNVKRPEYDTVTVSGGRFSWNK